MSRFGKGTLSEQVDNSPNWLCHHVDPRDFTNYLRLQGTRSKLGMITLPDAIYKNSNDQNGNYRTSLKMWFYRQPLVFTKGEASVKLDGSMDRADFGDLPEAERDEVLFDHEGVMKLYFKASSTEYLTLQHVSDQ